MSRRPHANVTLTRVVEFTRIALPSMQTASRSFLADLCFSALFPNIDARQADTPDVLNQNKVECDFRQ